MNKSLVILALAGLVALPVAAKPKVTHVNPPKTILFVGNSFNYYNNSLHGHVRLLERAADPAAEKRMVFKSMTISGGFLHEQAPALPAMLKSRHWDVVVLQG